MVPTGVVIVTYGLRTFSVVTEDRKREQWQLELKAFKLRKMDPSFLMEILAGKHARASL